MLAIAGCSVTGSAGSAASPTEVASQGGSPQTIEVPGVGMAATWGSGPYGLVLLHDVAHAPPDWNAQGAAFGNDGMTVLAPDRTDAASLRAAIEWLRSARGTARVAVLAAGATSESVVTLAASDASLIDQALLVSPATEVAWPWEFPTLFAAGRDAPDAAIAQRISAGATGQWNELLLVPSGHSGQALFISGDQGARELMTEVLRRLDERR
jgi:hypothetical protein